MKFKIPFWKKLLSWFFPIRIETVYSKFSKQLEINLQNGNLVIDSSNANYSFGNLHIVFQKAISQLKLKKNNHYKVLILGYGAGSIAQILKKVKTISCSITGIELDPTMILLSKKYFKQYATIIEEDAYKYLEINTNKYDLIFVDLFIDKQIPNKFQKATFFEKIKKSLSENGNILMNTMGNTNIIEKNWFYVFGEKKSYKIQENLVFHYQS